MPLPTGGQRLAEPTVTRSEMEAALTDEVMAAIDEAGWVSLTAMRTAVLNEVFGETT